jgi:hypothetical protein
LFFAFDVYVVVCHRSHLAPLPPSSAAAAAFVQFAFRQEENYSFFPSGGGCILWPASSAVSDVDAGVRVATFQVKLIHTNADVLYTYKGTYRVVFKIYNIDLVATLIFIQGASSH